MKLVVLNIPAPVMMTLCPPRFYLTNKIIQNRRTTKPVILIPLESLTFKWRRTCYILVQQTCGMYSFCRVMYYLPINLRTRVDNDPSSFGLTRPSFLEILETMFDNIFKCELLIVTWFARRHSSIWLRRFGFGSVWVPAALDTDL